MLQFHNVNVDLKFNCTEINSNFIFGYKFSAFYLLGYWVQVNENIFGV